MKKMSEFLDLPVEPAFRETQVILTGNAGRSLKITGIFSAIQERRS